MLRLLILSMVFGVACITVSATPVLADCRDEVQEVREEIDENKDDYSREALIKARKHLLQADIPSLKLVDCRRELLKAKKALRKGKR